jgi:transcription elongation factor GreA-like protein
MKTKRTVEQVKQMVIKQVTLRPELARWAFKRAKEEGHGDVSVIVRQGIDLLIARHKAGLPLA